MYIYFFVLRSLDKTGGIIQSPLATATEIISCCMILHNMAIRSRKGLDILEEEDVDGEANLNLRRIVNGEHFVLPEHLQDEQYELNDPQARDRQMNRAGQTVRNAICNEYF